MSLSRLNAVRILIVLLIAIGYASTMPVGPGNPEMLAHLGYDPSWIGIQVLFFISGYLAVRSARKHGSAMRYLRSRFIRNIPLLAVFTFIAAFIIYPFFGSMDGSVWATSGKLLKYFFTTVTCLNPGQPLPGLLDDAIYACIIQGAAWTFKWGMIAHLVVAFGIVLNLHTRNRVILTLTVFAFAVHFVLAYIQAKIGIDWLGAPNLAFRLAYPFLLGMTFFGWSDRLPKTIAGKTATLLALSSSAALWYYLLPWTPAIEMLSTMFWSYAAYLMLTSNGAWLKGLENWPNLALALYLANWPVSQLLMMGYPDLTPLALVSLAVPISGFVAIIAHTIISGPAYRIAKLKEFQPTLNLPSNRPA